MAAQVVVNPLVIPLNLEDVLSLILIIIVIRWERDLNWRLYLNHGQLHANLVLSQEICLCWF